MHSYKGKIFTKNFWFFKTFPKGKELEVQVITSKESTQLPQRSIEIDGRSFPPGIVIDWSDIKIRREIGEGNFGKVYQGYLYMNEVQR